MIFKSVGDGRPYPDHGCTPSDWATQAPRQIRLADLITTKRTLDLDALLDEQSTFYGDLFAHVVRWNGELYLEDGLHRALRTALHGRAVLHARILDLDSPDGRAHRRGRERDGHGGPTAMSMLSGPGLGQGDGRRRRHPVATGFLVVLMMLVLFGATFGAIRLLKGDGGADPSASSGTPLPCVSTTVTPGAALPKPATVTSNVYNATDRAGLARTTATTLKTRGFGIGSIANDPSGKSLATVAEIRYGTKGKDNALLMRFYVPGATLVLDQRNDATIDLVLGAKFKGIADQKAVNAALAKPVVVASGDGCTTPTPSTKPTGTAKPATSKSPSPKA